MSSPHEFKELVEKQKRRAIELRSEPLKNRKMRLRAIKKWIFTNQDKIQEAVYKDLQKPSQETDLSEIYPVVTEIREAISQLSSWAESEPVSSSLTYLGTKAYTICEPKGVCLIISPWNYPFNLSLGPAISALAAGNTVIIKPSEYVSNTNKVLAQLAEDLFEPDLFKVVEGESETAKALLELPIDHMFFTGSPSVGKLVMQAAAKNLTSVTLELGGKSPVIVDETASIGDAAQKIAWGKWLNAGQTCVAPDYVFVHKSRIEEFIKELIRSANELYGDGNYYSGIIHSKHLTRLIEMLKEASAAGSTVALQGAFDEEHCRMGPVIIRNPKPGLKIMEEEIFGPILPVVEYENIDDVIRIINRKPKPLSAYLFTKSRANQNQIETEISSGTLTINDCVLQFAHPSLPFGGIQNSGMGKGHGKAGFLSFSNQKSVLKQRRGFTMAKLVYPPYTPSKNRIIQWLLRYF